MMKTKFMFSSALLIATLILPTPSRKECRAQDASAANSLIHSNMVVERSGGDKPYGESTDVQPGDAVSFKILVENTGSRAGMKPRLTITLDPRLTYISNSSTSRVKQNNQNYDVQLLDSRMQFDGSIITYAFDDMAPIGSSARYITFQARVADAARFAVGKTTLQICSVAAFEDVRDDANCVSVIVTKYAQPVTSFSLRHEVTNKSLGPSTWYNHRPTSAFPGSIVAYRLTLQNTGNVPARNVRVKATLPTGLSFAGGAKLYNSASKQGMDVPGSAIVKEGYLFPVLNNGSVNVQTLIFNARVDDSPANGGNRTLITRSQLLYNGKPAAQDNAPLLVSATRGPLVVLEVQDPVDNQFKSQIGAVRQGQVLTYRLSIHNNGGAPFTKPVTRITLPPQMAYVTSSLAVDGEGMNSRLQKALFAPSSGITMSDTAPGFSQQITFRALITGSLRESSPVDASMTASASVKAENMDEMSDVAKAVLQGQRR